MATMSSQPISLPNNHNNSQDYTMGSGSYTGSNGSFNPASYTRQFLGSPISWRAGSFGFGGRLYSGSSIDLIGSLDTKPSSFGSDRESILNALSAIDREGEFCRNFMCCGLHLNDMHALVEHFEEVHVVVLDHPHVPGGQQAHVQIPFNPQALPSSVMPISQTSPMAMVSSPFTRQPTSQGQHQLQAQVSMQSQQQQLSPVQQNQYPGSFDTDDMELEMDVSQPQPPPYNQTGSSESSPSVSSGVSTPPDTPVSTPLSSYPSPTNLSPKAFLSIPSMTGHQQVMSQYNTASGYASQPPSPNVHHPSNVPVSAFETTVIRHPSLISSSSSSSLAGATTDPTAHAPQTRPNLNLNLTSFSRPASASPTVLEPFNPYARYAADFSVGMPGATLEGDVGIMDTSISVTSGPGPSVATVNENCVPPALVFSHANTPESTPAPSRVPSPSILSGSNPGSAGPSPTSPKGHSAANTPTSSNLSADGTAASVSSGANRLSTTLSRPATSLLLSKPFKCPKPNCNKSYKQANGLKYHLTHGSCNFAPPKDLEHVQAVLDRRRRERAAAAAAAEGGVDTDNNDRSGSGMLTPSGLNSPLSPSDSSSALCDFAADLGQITETELREVEREAEKRLRPFACGVGDCQRRYKNMNGLRYHYQHSGEHGAVGLALLASGVHECLSNNNGNGANTSPGGSSPSATIAAAGGGGGASSRDQSAVRGDRESRKVRTTGKTSKPGSRSASISRTSTPVAPGGVLAQQQYAAQSVAVASIQQSYVPGQASPQAASLATPGQPVPVGSQGQAHFAYQQRFAEHQMIQYAQQQQQQAQAAQIQQHFPQQQISEAQLQQIQQMQLAAFQSGIYGPALMDSS